MNNPAGMVNQNEYLAAQQRMQQRLASELSQLASRQGAVTEAEIEQTRRLIPNQNQQMRVPRAQTMPSPAFPQQDGLMSPRIAQPAPAFPRQESIIPRQRTMPSPAFPSQQARPSPFRGAIQGGLSGAIGQVLGNQPTREQQRMELIKELVMRDPELFLSLWESGTIQMPRQSRFNLLNR